MRAAAAGAGVAAYQSVTAAGSDVERQHRDRPGHEPGPLAVQDRAAMAHHAHRNAVPGASVSLGGMGYTPPHPTLRQIRRNPPAIPLPKRAAHH